MKLPPNINNVTKFETPTSDEHFRAKASALNMVNFPLLLLAVSSLSNAGLFCVQRETTSDAKINRLK